MEAEKAAALEEETRQKEALALEASELAAAAAMEKAAAMEEETRQKEAARLIAEASGARKRKKKEQSANERLALAVEMAERRRLKAEKATLSGARNKVD